jgi:hypothetical protein
MMWTKRSLEPLGPERFASSSYAIEAQPAVAGEQPAIRSVNACDGPPGYGGAAAQFDGRVDDIYFVHGSGETDGGEEQNEYALDDAYADEPDDADRRNESEFGGEYADDRDGAEEQNEYGFEFEDPYGDGQQGVVVPV